MGPCYSFFFKVGWKPGGKTKIRGAQPVVVHLNLLPPEIPQPGSQSLKKSFLGGKARRQTVNGITTRRLFAGRKNPVQETFSSPGQHPGNSCCLYYINAHALDHYDKISFSRSIQVLYLFIKRITNTLKAQLFIVKQRFGPAY